VLAECDANSLQSITGLQCGFFSVQVAHIATCADCDAMRVLSKLHPHRRCAGESVFLHNALGAQ
jgi:hypothetical protein